MPTVVPIYAFTIVLRRGLAGEAIFFRDPQFLTSGHARKPRLKLPMPCQATCKAASHSTTEPSKPSPT